MSQVSTLDALGLKHRTDKASHGHDYLNFYETYFAPLRDQAIVLLEIGVLDGASLKTWEEYFPHARIVGVDIMPACKRYERGRVKIELADQSNVEHLTRVALEHGPFDIIVEDGSHRWEHQITSLRTMFPFLKDDGLYVVEDLQTNYGAMQARYRGGASLSCVDFLKSWLDLRVADDQIDIQEVEDAFLRTYGRAVHFLTFYRRACLLKKRISTAVWAAEAGRPLVPGFPDSRSAPLSVMAHLGIKGDILGMYGFVDLGSDGFTVQGISIEAADDSVEYRVRFPDGSWSEWASHGAFAGTRGKALAVTGFTVRLAESGREKYALRAFGRFVGAQTPVEAAEGGDCVSPSGGALRGIQVELARRGD